MGPAVEATMMGRNVAHKGEQFGDEDDMLFLMLEFEGGTHAVVEYGSAIHWPEHYVLIQGTGDHPHQYVRCGHDGEITEEFKPLLTGGAARAAIATAAAAALSLRENRKVKVSEVM